jgi:hypothetical protein
VIESPQRPPPNAALRISRGSRRAGRGDGGE